MAPAMKLLFDFLPIVLFFGSYKVAGSHPAWAGEFATSNFGFLVSGGLVRAQEAPMLLATVVVILATLVQVLILKARRRRVDTMLWVSLALVVVLGGLTLWFHDETFIKWKPSVLYWCMGLALWLGPLVFGKNLLRALMGEQLDLPDRVWHRLNFAWIAFFASMGLVNLWVATHFSTDTWVDFKLFGVLGLMFVFMVAQGLVLSRYIRGDTSSASQGKP